MYRSYDTNSIYKDNTFKKVTGVCAGIARHYKLPRWAVRVGAIVSFLAFPIATGIAYVVATVLLRSR